MTIGEENLRQLVEGELRLKEETKLTILAPMATTTYFFPETGWFDLGLFGYFSFLIFTPDDDPLSCQIEASDGEDSGDLVGYTIPAQDYVVGSWNNLSEHPWFRFVRLRIATGAVPPSRIKLALVRRGT